MMRRSPMTHEQAAANANKLLEEENIRRRAKSHATRSDSAAFNRIKRTGKVPSLAEQLAEAFDTNRVDELEDHRRG